MISLGRLRLSEFKIDGSGGIMMVELKLNHIYKKYDGAEKYSVTDFNLDIEDREFIVLVGPSGCGKSTTIRMIAGLEDITEGELIIDGQVVNDVPPKDRDIAMVFQNYALYPHMTVYDNMAFGLKLRKVPKEEIDRRVREAAEILSLTEYLNRRPSELSGGQAQRVALGRAIVREAKVFLMDEPLSNLDAKLRVQMRAEIAKLHKRIKTITIYVTHDQTEAMTMADRIVIMKDGFIQQIGSPSEVYNYPDNVFVASFIGSPASNIFEVTYNDGRVTTEAGIDVAVTEPQKKLLDERVGNGQRVIMSIRPEDIQAEQIFLDANPDSIIEAEVVVSEMLGAESILYSQVGDVEIIAKVDARDFHEPGSHVQLGLNMNKAHFYDVETEEVIR